MQSRRRFLAYATAAAASGAVLKAGALSGAERPARERHRIDVHHHYFTPRYIEAARDRILENMPAFPQVLQWSPARSIEEMDRGGVATAVMSLTIPGVWLGDPDAAASLARDSNEFMARVMSDHPGRFGSFATLPMPDIDRSLKELEYAFDVLKADGVQLLTNYGDKWLGDPAFAALFAELNRRSAVVFVHPVSASCCGDIQPDVPRAFLEFPFDTTRAITSLLYSGTLSRHPKIRFIFCHSGGTLPMLADRIALLARVRKDLAERVPHGVEHEFRKLYYDTALSANPPAYAALSKLVPASQILFGTDYPFGSISGTATDLARLGIPAADLAAIEGANARRLFPRLAG